MIISKTDKEMERNDDKREKSCESIGNDDT